MGGTAGRRAARTVLVAWTALASADAGAETQALGVLVDQLELRAQNGADAIHWEQGAWVGRAWRLAFDSSGDVRTSEEVGGEAELQLSLGRTLGEAVEIRAGVRHDRLWGPGPDRYRTFAALDANLAIPWSIELAPALFLSDDGDLSARLTALGELPLTARWIAQGRFEANAAAHDVPRWGVERGGSDVELGLRLRFEAAREVAPYVGVSWIRALGNTADRLRDDGDDAYRLAFVAGLRLAF